MIRALVLACLLLPLAACQHLPTPPEHSAPVYNDVFMVAGQSNAVSNIEHYAGPHSGVLQWSTSGKVFINNMPDNYYEIYSPTPDFPTSNSIAWLYCAEAVAKESGRDVTFVNMAWGGSSSRDWTTAPHLERFLQAVHDFKPKVILWHQGEHDEKYGIPEEESYANIKRLVILSRTIIPGLPWIVALNSQSLPSANAPIRRAQKRLINEGLVLEGPDTDTLREDRSNMDEDNLHFVGKAFEKHGLMWYEALKKYGFI